MSFWFVRHPGENDLALFAGGELGLLARWRVEGHLSSCPACRHLVAEFFEMRSKVMDLADLPHINWDALATGIHREAARQRESAPRVPRWRPAWGAALAVLALVVAGAYVIQWNATPDAILDASAGAVELRLGPEQVFTLVNTAGESAQVMWRVSADTASARYVDQETGQITINHVYVAQ
jgi:anti-sigma factor RsiW